MATEKTTPKDMDVYIASFPADIREKLEKILRSLFQLYEQRMGILKVVGIESFSEPAVDF